MLRNYSKWLMLAVVPVWVAVSFFTSQALVMGLIWVLVKLGVPLASFNQVILDASVAACVYLITLVLVIGAPLLIKKRRTSQADIGLTRLPTWTDILITPAGFIVYLILSIGLIILATKLLPGFDVNQVQEVGFKNLAQRYEYILAFVVLIIVTPVAEEILFRGYLFGKLKKFVPVWVAILATSVLFGALHGTWNVAIDTFALSVVLCVLREITGSLWPSILLHMAKNSIAFYVLFINPSILATLVR